MNRVPNPSILETATVDAAGFILDRERKPLRDAIILRLSRRGSVVQMEQNDYEFVWRSLVRTIAILLRPVCIKLIGSTDFEDGEEK
jgi:hypothetical protein